MQFRVLGPVELAAGGRVVAVRSRRRRRLLAALLARSGHPVPAERLVDALWGSDPPPSARRSLHSHVSRLRDELRALDGRHDRIVTRGGGYALVADGEEVDAVAFERDVRHAKELAGQHPAAAVELAEQALARWRGPPYMDAADAVEDEVRRLWSVHRAACDVRVEALLASGRAEDVVGELEASHQRDPLEERTVAQLMLALFHSGRQADAIATFHGFRRRLGDELGVDPSPWLQDRYAALLRQDERLRPAAPPPAPGGGPTAVPDVRRPGLVAPAGTSFVGREAAVADVARVLATTSLVTVTGPGGVGKTRLAEAVVAAVAGSFDDVVTLELAAVRDAPSLDAAVAAACGIAPGAGRSVRDGVVDALRGRAVLLVADNCEHLLPDVAALVEQLVIRCPSLTVLATSRERLAIPGERHWPLAPLRLPPWGRPPEPGELRDVPAVRLFCDRAAAADPAFELTAGNAVAVAELCRRLDGLPLALELAAARVAAFTVEELARRLDERFELLTTGPPHDGGRHRTLHDVVAWSCDLLDSQEVGLFHRLSVFAGGFTMEAAEAVGGGPGGAVAPRLAALVDASMVVRSGPRYDVLETLRLYGARRLAELGQDEDAKRAHARYFAAFAARAGDGVRGPDDAAWAARSAAELDNLRAAHRWALAAGEADLALRLSAPLVSYADAWLVDEIFSWAEQAAAMPGARGHPLQPLAWAVAARGSGNRGALGRSATLARKALTAAGSDHRARVAALRALSLATFYEGRLDRSAALETEVLALGEQHTEPYDVAYAWVMRALIATYRGDADAAQAAAGRAHRGAQAVGATHLRALAAYAHGEALAAVAPEAALAWLEDAVATARDAGARLVEAIASVSCSSIRADRGDRAAALDFLRETVDRLRRGGDWTHQWTTLRNVAFLLVRSGADEAAAELIGAVETSATAAPVYGADAARMRSAVGHLRDRLGADAFERAHDRGRRLGDAGAVDAALSALDRLRAATD